VRTQFAKELAERAIGPSSGFQNRNGGYALTAFGKPARVENCDCERSFEPSLLQVLYVRNDQESLAMIERRGSWVEQVAKAHKLDFRPQADGRGEGGGDRTARQLAQLEKELKSLDKRIKNLRKEGNDDEADQLASNRTRVQRRIERLKPMKSEENQQQASDPTAEAGQISPEQKLIEEEGRALVRDAYLRTVSREPAERELSRRSLDYLRQSPTLTIGLRDLMWALVNTKEFIVNH
jgi:hypothetical protein